MDDAFELCDKTVVDIARKTKGKLQLDALTPTEATVILVYQVCGLIGIGGLKGLLCDEFDGDPGYVRTISAFQEIGSTTVASILNEALDLWNSVDHSRLEDPEYLIDDEYLADEHPEIFRRLSILEDQFDNLESDTLTKLGDFIRNSSK
ncbi:MAG TPA: hypothetical protein VJ828_04280 [Lacipirellulaceae bacterium]|nr:hypothetical protein [Lacipirellulaceae bacterium]